MTVCGNTFHVRDGFVQCARDAGHEGLHAQDAGNFFAGFTWTPEGMLWLFPEPNYPYEITRAVQDEHGNIVMTVDVVAPRHAR